MAFSVPTLEETVRTVENGFSSAFYGSAGVLRVTVLKLLAKVIGAAVYLPLLACKYIWSNSFVSTADAEGLVKIGSDCGLPHKPVLYAHGTATFAGASGTTISAGTILVYETTGKEYELLSAVTIASSGSGTGEIKAVEAGSDSNLGSGVSITLTFRDGTPTGVNTVYTSDTDGGRSESVQVGSSVEDWGETLEEYRARLKYYRQKQPHGGCDSDYVKWCYHFDYVTAAYACPAVSGANTNDVYIYCANGAVESYTITAAQAAEIQAYINDESRKPITANVVVKSVTATSFAINMKFASVSSVLRSTVEAAIKKYLKTLGPGDTIQKVDILAVMASVTGDASCSVVSITKDGGSIGNSYVLDKTSTSGEVVNINGLTFTFAQS